MSKVERGTKRACPNCGARFYDLGRDPAVCPSCQTVCRIDQPAPRRAVAAKAKPVAVVVDEVAQPVAAADEPETISLDEVEEETPDAVESDEIEEIADLDDDDANVGDDADDTFLEEEEDGEPDVSKILKT